MIKNIYFKASCQASVFWYLLLSLYWLLAFPLFDDHFKEKKKSSSANIWQYLKMYSTFSRKNDHQNLITNFHDNHEYLYDTSQTRAQWDPSVWSWLMGSLHMYPFRLNGSYLVIFCHMYTTHSRLNVSKSSFRNILSNQMGYIWPRTHAIHIYLAFFIVVLFVEYQNDIFSKATSPHLPLYF